MANGHSPSDRRAQGLISTLREAAAIAAGAATRDPQVPARIEAALKKIEEQIKVIRDVQGYRKRGLKAAATRRKREAKA